jgi:hypothetical protein
MSFIVARFASAPSVDLATRVRHAFNSIALLKANASIPGMSTPLELALFTVFAVDDVSVFRFVMMVVLGTMLIISPFLS